MLKMRLICRLCYVAVVLAAASVSRRVDAFSVSPRTAGSSSRRELSNRLESGTRVHAETDPTNNEIAVTRRNLLSSLGAFAAVALSTKSYVANAADDAQATAIRPPTEFKDFVDPLFSIRLPKNYFTLRRSAKGDLPDAKTGDGRRGSSIFSAGDMAKAEVVAVERFPTRLLLEENGIQSLGDLSTFAAIGEKGAVANLINLRRAREATRLSNTIIFPESLEVSADGKELEFKLKTEIDVQKPELLMEQYGVNQLFRVSAAKATLRSNDGNMMVVFASALEQDFNGPDGADLMEAVNSFQVTDQSSAAAA